MTWKEISGGDVFAFEKPGDVIEGTLTSIRDGQFRRDTGQQSKVFDIETLEGLKTIFGTTILESRITDKMIGKRFKIEFVEEQPPKIRGHNPTKIFKVFVDEE